MRISASFTVAVLAGNLLTQGCTGEASSGSGISRVWPDRGSARGGEEVLLAGQGFEEGAKVYFSDVEGGRVHFLSEKALVATTPVMTAGAVSVAFENPSGGKGGCGGCFFAEKLDVRYIEAAAGLLPGLEGASVTGGAAADLDGDDDQDIIVPVSGGRSRLLLNSGAGSFEDRTEGAQAGDAGVMGGLPETGADTRAVVAEDLDNDGKIDLFACNGSGGPNRLFFNDGKALFEEAAEGGLPAEAESCAAAAAGDLDGDGRADIVTVNLAAEAEQGPQIRVYRNLGVRGRDNPQSRFEAVPSDAIPQHQEKSSSVAIADADGDGDFDVIVASSESGESAYLRLFLNETEKPAKRQFVDGGEVEEPEIKFSEAEANRLPAFEKPVSFVAAVDVDRDGDQDLIAVCADGQDRLIENDGRGRFKDATADSMPVDRAAGRFAAFADLDLDGFSDVLIANFGGQNRLYLNDGKGRLVDATPRMPILKTKSVWAGAIDVDSDGDADLVFLNGEGDAPKIYLSVEAAAGRQ